jgi:hypothetical protein
VHDEVFASEGLRHIWATAGRGRFHIPLYHTLPGDSSSRMGLPMSRANLQTPEPRLGKVLERKRQPFQ